MCSSWIDKAWLNEYFFGTNSFLEVYSKTATFPSSWQGWTINVYNNHGLMIPTVTLNDSTAFACTKSGNKTWVTHDVSDNGFSGTVGLVVLKDSAGYYVDALAFDNASPPASWTDAVTNYFPTLADAVLGCPTLATRLTNQAATSGTTANQANMLIWSSQGNKDYSRMPDGSSNPWYITSLTGAGTTYTTCTSNNGNLTKTVNTGSAAPGGAVSFSVTMANASSSAMTGTLSIVDTLPAMTLVSAQSSNPTDVITYSADGTNYVSTPPANVAYIKWTPATLAGNARIVLTVNMTVPAGATVGAVYTNSVTTSGTALSPQQSDSASVTVVSPNTASFLVDASPASSCTGATGSQRPVVTVTRKSQINGGGSTDTSYAAPTVTAVSTSTKVVTLSASNVAAVSGTVKFYDGSGTLQATTTATASCTTTPCPSTITVASTAGIAVGQTVSGLGIAGNATLTTSSPPPTAVAWAKNAAQGILNGNIYAFSPSDNGTASFYLTDSRAETIDVVASDAAGAVGEFTSVIYGSSCSAIVDHVRIEHDGTGGLCTREPVTFKACTNSSCSSLYAASIALTPTVTPTGGTWYSAASGGSAVTSTTFTGSTTLYLQYTKATTATYGATGLSVTPTNGVLCDNTTNGTVANGTTECRSVFSNISFKVEEDYLAPEAVPGTGVAIAGRDHDMRLTALLYDGTSPLPAGCSPLTSYTASGIKASLSRDVTADPGGAAPTVSSISIPNSPATATLALSSWTNGASSFYLATTDVGKYTINFIDDSLSVSSANITGSQSLIVRPYGFSLAATCGDSTANAANQITPSASDPKFCPAGQNFSATVTALTQALVAAPSYGKEVTPETVSVAWALQLPATGSSGTLPSGALAFSGSGGKFGPTNFSWSEVGMLKATTSVGDGDYLGAGNVSSVAYVGRFYPDHFDTTATGPMTCASGLVCPAGGMAYSGQPFGSVVVVAKNASGGQTSNYDSAGGFAKAATLGAVAASGGAAIAPAVGTLAPTSVPASAFTGGTTALTGTIGATNGSAAIVGAGTAFTTQLSAGGSLCFLNACYTINGIASNTSLTLTSSYTGTTAAGLTASKLAPAFSFAASPYAPTDVHVRATETSGDSVSSLRAAAATSVEGGVKVVAGRVRLTNAYGSERLPLAIPAEAQYYSGTYWLTNSGDSSSTSGWSVSPASATALAGTGASGSSTLALGSSLASGAVALTASAPGPGGFGYLDLTLVVPDYLKFPWNGGATLANPTARATFGVYKGSDRIIYRREQY